MHIEEFGKRNLIKKRVTEKRRRNKEQKRKLLYICGAKFETDMEILCSFFFLIKPSFRSFSPHYDIRPAPVTSEVVDCPPPLTGSAAIPHFNLWTEFVVLSQVKCVMMYPDLKVVMDRRLRYCGRSIVSAQLLPTAQLRAFSSSVIKHRRRNCSIASTFLLLSFPSSAVRYVTHFLPSEPTLC